MRCERDILRLAAFKRTTKFHDNGREEEEN